MKKFLAFTIALLMVTVLAVTAFAQANANTNANTVNAPASTNTADTLTGSNFAATDITASDTTKCPHEWELEFHKEYHISTCIICGYSSEKQPHTFETDMCTVCGFTSAPSHSCQIAKATEKYHRFNCDECENYTRVNHDETTMKAVEKNKWFHTWVCYDCGYEYAVRHNFETSYNSTSHQDVCVDCGYAEPSESHVMANDFYGNSHDIICDWCGYISEHHVNTKYATFDEHTCLATCSCGATEIVDHDWDGFVCEGCSYSITDTTYGIVTAVSYRSENVYIRLLSDEQIFRFYTDFDMVNFKEGDFIAVDHTGNDIHHISVLVNGDIINDVENFQDYVSLEIIESSYSFLERKVTFEDLIIEDFLVSDTKYGNLIFKTGYVFGFSIDEYVVLDMVYCDWDILMNDDAVLRIATPDKIYFLTIQKS